jgi:hypothetical protein
MNYRLDSAHFPSHNFRKVRFPFVGVELEIKIDLRGKRVFALRLLSAKRPFR